MPDEFCLLRTENLIEDRFSNFLLIFIKVLNN